LSPKDGSDVRGVVWLAAGASGRAFATTHVQFTVSGMAETTTVLASPSEFGWIGGLDTTRLPDGTYTIRSSAANSIGGTGRSEPVSVHIDN
jgi:hypothetical protein